MQKIESYPVLYMSTTQLVGVQSSKYLNHLQKRFSQISPQIKLRKYGTRHTYCHSAIGLDGQILDSVDLLMVSVMLSL